jgi:hypothetical protein
VNFVIVWKDKLKFHALQRVTAITLLLIGIIISSGTLFAFPFVLLNHIHAAMARKQQQLQATGNSFQIGNMTFSHHTASVNGIKLQYIIGGHGSPVVLLHGWPWPYDSYYDSLARLSRAYRLIHSSDSESKMGANAS